MRALNRKGLAIVPNVLKSRPNVKARFRPAWKKPFFCPGDAWTIAGGRPLQKKYWVSMESGFKQFLPKNRPYSELEAAFCLKCDWYERNGATIAGYAALWQWTRRRVRGFLDAVGVSIEYPKDTKKYRNQSGHIAIHKTDISDPKNGHIKFCNSNNLECAADISKPKSGHKADISRSTTIRTENREQKETLSGRPDNAPVLAVISYLNEKTGKSFRATTKPTIEKIRARFKDGFTLDDFKTVIDKKTAQWSNDPKMSEYLRPKTLFTPENFESYLNKKTTEQEPTIPAHKLI